MLHLTIVAMGLIGWLLAEQIGWWRALGAIFILGMLCGMVAACQKLGTALARGQAKRFASDRIADNVACPFCCKEISGTDTCAMFNGAMHHADCWRQAARRKAERFASNRALALIDDEISTARDLQISKDKPPDFSGAPGGAVLELGAGTVPILFDRPWLTALPECGPHTCAECAKAIDCIDAFDWPDIRTPGKVTLCFGCHCLKSEVARGVERTKELLAGQPVQHVAVTP